MFSYKLIKFAIFIIYWLGFVPWLVLLLRREELLYTANLQDLIFKYATVFFIIILIYMIIYQVFEYFYVRHKIKKIVRKVTIRHQLERLERGEIDLIAAQRTSTFTKLKPPKRLQKKRKSLQASKTKLVKKKPINVKDVAEKLSKEKLGINLKQINNEEIKEGVQPPSYMDVVVKKEDGI